MIRRFRMFLDFPLGIGAGAILKIDEFAELSEEVEPSIARSSGADRGAFAAEYEALLKRLFPSQSFEVEAVEARR